MVKTVTAAVIMIGDEILSGRTQDSNLRTLAAFLAPLGVEVREARVIPDVHATILATVQTLRKAHDYVFTTGGIGPTHDDITADAVAAAFNRPISVRADARAILEAYYAGRDTDLNESRLRMARIPEGATLIANPVSGAPGFQIGNVFVMAGVPRIMTAMLEDLVPRLRTGAVVHARTLRVTGVGEGMIAAPLAEAAGASRDLSFGSYPFGAGSDGEVGTNLVVRGRDAAAVEAAVDALAATLGATGIATRRQ